MQKFGFVILHYKDTAVTERCVQSILQMPHQEKLHIVIVDNDLQESTKKRQELQLRYADIVNVTVLTITENGGFSHANNRGYEWIKQNLGDAFVVAANNDIEFVQQDFLHRVESLFQQKNCHIIAPDVIRCSTGEHQNPMDTRLRTKKEADYTIRMNRISLRLYPILYPFIRWKLHRDEKKSLEKKKRQEEFYHTAHTNIVPFGACLIFTPEFVKNEQKAFEPETQFFYEEYILALRCQRTKYSICYEPSVQVHHESGQATRRSYKSEKKRIRFMLERTLEACEVYRELIER